MSEQSEKRRRRRVPFELKATFQTEKGTVISGTLSDLSMSGFLMHSKEKQPVGTNETIQTVLQSGNDAFRVNTWCTLARLLEGSLHTGSALQLSEIDTDSAIHLCTIINFQSAKGLGEF